jgi:hypothetical protein
MVGRGMKAMAVPTPIKAIVLSIVFPPDEFVRPVQFPDTPDDLNEP